MSIEQIFNIFVYFDGGVACEYGVRHHQIAGNDIEKKGFLLCHVETDHPVAQRFPLPSRFTPSEWLAAQRLGNCLGYFEEAFQLFRAPPAPMLCVTSIVDGEPRADRRHGPEPFRGEAVSALEGYGVVPDYLVHYTDGNHFRFIELIHDDYFQGIRTLFNAGLYVSCAKLLMSCVDTLAFVEFGDTQSNFASWLDSYVDLSPHGITSKELWEFRNSVLHMTNLSSRKIVTGKISPIMPYVGTPDMLPVGPDGAKPFNLYGLIDSVATGVGKWAESYNADRDKFLKFIERYDTTISDSRLAYFSRSHDAGRR